MSYTIFVYFFLTSWVMLQAYSEDGCCGGYHIGLLENITNTLSSSKEDRSTPLLENRKAVKFLGEEIGKYFTELGDDFVLALEDLRKGLGDDLSENKIELKGNREEQEKNREELKENNEELKRFRQDFGTEIKEHGNRLETTFEKEVQGLGNKLEGNFGKEIQELRNRLENNLGREIRDLREGLGEELKNNGQELTKVEEAVNKLSEDLRQELKGISQELKGIGEDIKKGNKELKSLGEEIKKGNEEIREERKTQHEAMMMVFNTLLENRGNGNGVISSSDGEVSSQLKENRNSADIEKDMSNSPDCASLYKSGKRTSGVYKVKASGVRERFDVYCDMEKDGGGWTVIQRRGKFSTPDDYFYKTWDEYKKGFGKLDEEHWLGNDKISALSKQGTYELHIEMLDYDQNRTFARYGQFMIEGEEELYQLHVSNFSGNTRDSMAHHNGMVFSTYDRDNDNKNSNCAVEYAGAWWYLSCMHSNLNSKKDRNKIYLSWFTSTKGWVDLTSVLMKIRPLTF